MTSTRREVIDIGQGQVLETFIDGSGPLVFALGHPSMQQTAEPGAYAKPLAEWGTVIRPNLPSAGASTPAKSKQDMTIAKSIDELDRLRAALGHEQWVWLGWSAGGFMGLDFAQRYPQSIKALLLGATGATGQVIMDPDSIYSEAHPEHAEVVRLRTAAYAKGAKPEQMRAWAQIMFRNPAAVDAVVAQVAQHRPGESPERASAARGPVIAAECRGTDGFKQFDYRPGLGRIDVPTLVMGGRHDRICPIRWGEEIHRGIPGSEMVVFEHSGHACFSDEPEAFRATLESFLWRHIPADMRKAS